MQQQKQCSNAAVPKKDKTVLSKLNGGRHNDTFTFMIGLGTYMPQSPTQSSKAELHRISDEDKHKILAEGHAQYLIEGPTGHRRCMLYCYLFLAVGVCVASSYSSFHLMCALVQAYCLNFNGRVKLPSSRNCQVGAKTARNASPLSLGALG